MRDAASEKDAILAHAVDVRLAQWDELQVSKALGVNDLLPASDGDGRGDDEAPLALRSDDTLREGSRDAEGNGDTESAAVNDASELADAVGLGDNCGETERVCTPDAVEAGEHVGFIHMPAVGHDDAHVHNSGAPLPAGQYDPVGQTVAVGEVEPAMQ